MKKNVMVVDDDASVRLTVEAVLQPQGFDVTSVEGGERCLAELEKGFHGVVLMDVMMPRMNGWETVREIIKRRLLDGNLISMLTAKDDPDPDMEGLAEYVLNYIRKPFEPAALISVVDEYCSYLE